MYYQGIERKLPSIFHGNSSLDIRPGLANGFFGSMNLRNRSRSSMASGVSYSIFTKIQDGVLGLPSPKTSDIKQPRIKKQN